MAWIESHQEIKDHPKTARLARYLAEPLAAAIGRLHCLWWWALDYAEDGDLSRFDAADLAHACLWDGEPEALLNALIRAGFVDRVDAALYIHDWEEYAGRLLTKRRAAVVRTQRWRDAQPTAPSSNGVPDEVQAAPRTPAGNGADVPYAPVTHNERIPYAPVIAGYAPTVPVPPVPPVPEVPQPGPDRTGPVHTSGEGPPPPAIARTRARATATARASPLVELSPGAQVVFDRWRDEHGKPRHRLNPAEVRLLERAVGEITVEALLASVLWSAEHHVPEFGKAIHGAYTRRKSDAGGPPHGITRLRAEKTLSHDRLAAFDHFR